MMFTPWFKLISGALLYKWWDNYDELCDLDYNLLPLIKL